MMMRKSSGLHTTFYRNFLLLIVIPILLIFGVALGIIRSIMLENSYNTLEMAQNNVSATISTEIKNASLKFTHFLLTNNRQALVLAENAMASTGQEQYKNITQLKELYNFVVTPSSDIFAIHFYAENGQKIQLKNDLAIPLDELKESGFYQNSVASPGHTHYSLINENVMFIAQKVDKPDDMLVLSFSPGDRRGVIESVCWYTSLSANLLIDKYSKQTQGEEMFLVDASGNILVRPSSKDDAYTLPEEIKKLPCGRHSLQTAGKPVNVLVTEVPDTDWKIVSVVANSALFGNLNSVITGVIFVGLVVFGLFYLFSRIFLRNIILPINTLVAGMSEVEEGRLDTQIVPQGQNEIRVLIDSFNSMAARIQELLLLTEQQQQEKMKAEMDALQSQINPHFLVNTLNSIRFTAMVSKFDSIKNMAEALIKILSASFKDPNNTYSIKDEIEILESYTYLMKIRYSENFDIEWLIEDECLSYSIPRLLIQPIVENAIVHGFEDKEEPGKMLISIKKRGEEIHIMVSDDGKGMDVEAVKTQLRGESAASQKGHGIGLCNVNRRIKLNYGAEFGIQVENRPGGGSAVLLTIPAIKAEKGV